MKCERGEQCAAKIAGLPANIIETIKSLTNLQEVGFVLVVGRDGAGVNEITLVPLVPDGKQEGVRPLGLPNVPENATALLDVANVTILRLEGSRFCTLHPHNIKIPC